MWLEACIRDAFSKIGWRIYERRVKQLYFNTAQLKEAPGLIEGVQLPFKVKEEGFLFGAT